MPLDKYKRFSYRLVYSNRAAAEFVIRNSGL